jgi:glycosyltransferase involved in cell wall biosynthesis
MAKNKSLKIAILTHTYIPSMGGYQIFTYNLAQQLSVKNKLSIYLYNCECLAFKKLGLKTRYHVKPIFNYEHRLLKLAPFFLQLLMLIRQLVFRYDVWLVVGAYPSGLIGRLLPRIVPVALRAHGSDIQKNEVLSYGLRLNPIIDMKIRDVIQTMTKLVALTPTVVDCYNELGASKDTVVEIPNGVDMKRFQRNINREQLREEFGVKPDEILILTTGRYNKKKGYEYIPPIAKLLVKDNIKFKWLIVGTSSDSILPVVIENEMDNFVKCIEGKKPEKSDSSYSLEVPSDYFIDLYLIADIFVFPSLLETFGMVLIEAMAAGLPIVTINSPGCRDVVQNKVNGLVADSIDPTCVAECIKTILSNNHLRNQLVTNAKETVMAKYDWPVIAQQYESLFVSLINERRCFA